MSFNRDNLKSFGGFLLSGAISCLSASPAVTTALGIATGGVPSLLLGLAGSITGSFAGEHLNQLISFSKLKERLKDHDPNNVHHDLERLFKEAAVISIIYIKKLFLAELKNDPNVLFGVSEKERKQIINSAEKFLDQNVRNIKEFIGTEPVDQLQIKEPQEFLTSIAGYLIGITDADIRDDIKQKLSDFYAVRLPCCFELAFKEALKNDEQGFKAFQMWMLESSQNLNRQIAGDLKKLQEQLAALPTQPLETIVEIRTEEIYQQFEQDFVDIKNMLEALTLQVSEQYRQFYRISEELLETARQTSKDVRDIKDDVAIVKNHTQQILEKVVPAYVIPHHLTPLPFVPEVFLGRKEELKEIKEKLFAGDNFLLLMNGHGGVGKTSLAATYYHTYCDEYKHAAWVLSEKSVANAMLLLATPLRVTFEETMPTRQRLRQLVAAIVELGKPCLLVIDNVDEPEDLEKYYPLLRQCSNFHLLLTSRITKFQQAETYRVAGLPESEALALFKKYYPKHTESEDELFKQTRLAVDCNTLVIELLAKNLYIQNRLKANYTLENLLTDLQQKGVLGISKSTVVDSIGYHAKEGMFRKEDPKDIIAAMYDLGGLSRPEIVLLSVFAVLPAENLPYDMLETLLPETGLLEENVLELSQKGWLDHNEPTASFKISPVVQEITRNKNQQLLQDCNELISSLLNKLEYQGGAGHLLNCTYGEAATYTRYAESVLNSLPEQNNSCAVLYGCIGSYYSTIGNLIQALTYYEQLNQLETQLHQAYPDNVDFKDGLAFSYLKLGNIQSSLGNLEQALAYYEQLNQLEVQLHHTYPDNVKFKNGLAISYSKLGEVQSSLGNLDQALPYYEQDAQLIKELHQAYPDNVGFKNNLAISYQNLGEVQSSLGNLEQALTYYEQDAQLIKELHQAYPDNVDFKNGLAISYSKLGNIQSSLGNLEQALTYYDQYNQLEAQLYQAYPDYVVFKNGLAISCAKLGFMYKDNLSNTKKAIFFFKQAEKLWAELVAVSPNYAQFKKYLESIRGTISEM